MAKRRHARSSARNGRVRLASRTFYRRPLTLEPLEDRRLLAVVTVNTDQDVVDFGDGLTSLREAIFATNLVAGADTIEFNFGHDGPTTILLTQGELHISDHLTINGPGTSLLTIDASGNDPTPDMNNGDGSRVFRIDDGSLAMLIDVVVSGVTLTGGDANHRGGAIYARDNLTVREVTIADNASSIGGGGGIAALIRDPLLPATSPGPGSLIVLDSTISGNVARGPRASGGGIYSLMNPGGEVTIDGTSIADNRADARGGGITASASSEGQFSLSNSRLLRNATQNSGGGLFVQATSSGRVSIEGTTISGNTAAGSGGGIYAPMDRGSVFEMLDSTISENTVQGFGGGGMQLRADNESSISVASSTIHGNQARNGGGILVALVRGGTATIVQSTVTGNHATTRGGGIYFSEDAHGGPVNLRHTTIFGNTAGVGGGGITALGADLELFVNHSIVAGNSSDISRPAVVGLNVHHSLISDNTGSGLAEAPVGAPDAHGNIIGGPVHGVIDPLLGPLADNGGPTLTHALLPGSPAINRGDLNAVAGEEGVPLFDQRGEPFARIAGGRIDIGAFELQTRSDLNLLMDTLEDENDGDHGRGDLSLREAIALANAAPSDDTIRFDPLLAGGTILLTLMELSVTDDVAIIGLGADQLTIDASGNDATPDVNDGKGSRIFAIGVTPREDSAGVQISGLTLTGGDVSTIGGGAILNKSSKLLLEEVVITGNHATGDGGGVASPTGTLTVVESTISGNRARRGGAISSSGGDTVIDSSRFVENTASERGGAVFFFRSTAEGDLKVFDSTFSHNSVINENGFGGAIYANDFPAPTPTGMNALTITGNIITENTTRGDGAGIFARMTRGSIQINENELVGNTASNPNSRGGGILLESMSSTSELMGNTLRENSAGRGGGIYVISLTADNTPSTVLIDDNAITSNTATSGESEGGGIAISGQGVTATVRNSTIEGNRAIGTFGRGGGIFMSGGPLTIESSMISGNSASRFGGGVYARSGLELVDSRIAGNTAQRGGGIDTRSESQPVEIAGSEFAANTATGEMGHGGAVHHQAGRLTVDDTVFSENSANGSGGAIYATGGFQAAITNSEFVGNSAALDGGAVASFVFAGRQTSLNLAASSFANNRAGRNGGGLLASGRNVVVASSLFHHNEAGQNGGAIGVQGGPFTLINSTLSSNLAHVFGGGMWSSPAVTVAHSTIYQNEAGEAGGGAFAASGTLSLENTIVAGNIAIPNGPDLGGFLGATLNPRFSLIGTNIGSGLPPSPGVPDANGNLIGIGTGIDPRLGPLADNGGDTLTHALLPDSPAINAGDPSAAAGVAGVPTHDQRGEPFIRIFGGRIDIGAFERLPAGFLPGDFSRDGIVDAADYVVWRSQLGMSVDPGTGADGNGDGVVDERDYTVWRSNFMSDLADLGPSEELPLSVSIKQSAEEASEPARFTLEPRGGSAAERLVADRAQPAARAANVAARHDDALSALILSSERKDGGLLEFELGWKTGQSRGRQSELSGDKFDRVVDRVFETIAVSHLTRRLR